MADITPVTRMEKIASGDLGITPVTRLEKLLHELVLKVYGSGGGSPSSDPGGSYEAIPIDELEDLYNP